MSEWWEKPYNGAPMVRVPGFPRPLYPLDAAQHGKQPSVDGPDVIAYKRTVSRAGRWPWQPFDMAYSNGFAHGNGGNVINTGVAGVQRQQQIDATGWLGKTTFNMLRSIVIPAGLPHAGEMAMDGMAADLIADAWDLFLGHEPPPPPVGSVRTQALSRAITQIGVAESPPGSNLQRYGDWYGMNGVPWCAIFCSWCFELAADALDTDSQAFAQGSRYSYVPYVLGDAQAGRYGLSITFDPIPGDLVLYDWQWNGEYDHIGIFERWQGADLVVVEGNTSNADNSNGGQVMRRVRAQSGQATTFIRVAE